MPNSKILSGVDRYNFMLALAGHLITHRHQPIKRLVERFSVSEKEIRDAAVTISLSGVGNYTPGELFFLDYDLLDEGIVDISFSPALESVPRLSTRQVAAISTGLSYLSTVMDVDVQKEIADLLKLLGTGESAADLQAIGIIPNRELKNLSLIRRAIGTGKVIECEYLNTARGVSQRMIEPLLLQSLDSNWYLKAFCRNKNSVRVFRLDRMTKIKITSESFDYEERSKGVDEALYELGPRDIEVEFEVDPEAYSFIADFKPEYQLDGSGVTRVVIPIGNPANLGRVVARYAGKVRVLRPKLARDSVKSFALAALGETNQTMEIE